MCQFERNAAVVFTVYIGLCVSRKRDRISAAYCVYFFLRDMILYLNYWHNLDIETTYVLFNARVLCIFTGRSPWSRTLQPHLTVSSTSCASPCCQKHSVTRMMLVCALVLVRACARARAPRRMSGCLSGCTGVGGCVSCYHDHTRGQRSKTAGPEEERNGERGRSDEDEGQKQEIKQKDRWRDE